MNAYRAGHGRAPAPEGHEDGLVDELIQQFADPLAFFRELVQNSIDAGATQVAVTIGFDAAAPSGGDEFGRLEMASLEPLEPLVLSREGDEVGRLEVTVRDDGCGMSREILEEQLTVLFRSSKEGQADKIGKFGVGFVSVLALEPELVSVRTSEGDGTQWTLELLGDQTYELFRGQGSAASGTSVTLRIPKRKSELEAFIDGSERALRKWCRHAQIPIRLVASVSGAEILRESRIDSPLGLDALVSVRVEQAGTTVLAGLPSDTQPYLGFFNRGLLLHETATDLFGSVMVLIQDGRLEHTLSRDNVRQDEHYARAMALARRVVDRELTREVHDVLRELANRSRPQPSIEAVLGAALHAQLDLDRSSVRLPLLEPARGQTTLRLTDLSAREVYVGASSDDLTRAVAERGARIVDLSVAENPPTYRALLAALAGQELGEVHAELTLATPVETSGADQILMDRVGDLVAKLVRRPNGPTLAHFVGARSAALQLAGGSGELPLTLDVGAVAADPFRLLRRPAWLLNAQDPKVCAARRLAIGEPALAAALLTRALLLDRFQLNGDGDQDWLTAASGALAS